MSNDDEVIDLSALKVAELKNELRSRKLPVSGTKAELIDRLEAFMQENEEVTVVEEDEYNKLNESKVVEVPAIVSSPPPVNSISMTEEEEDVIDNTKMQSSLNDVKPNLTPSEISTLSEKDRIKSREDRFNQNSISSPGDKKAKDLRAERFGDISDKKAESTDALKRRAERFGLPISNSKISKLGADKDKLADREQRFGTVAKVNSGGGGDKLALRRARFGVV